MIFFAALLVNVVISAVFHSLTQQPRGRLVHFIQGYTDFVIRDLGDPPQLERAMRFVDDFGLNIYFIGKTNRWATTGRLEDLNEVKLSRFHSGLGMDYGYDGRKIFFRLIKPQGEFYFSPDFVIDPPRHQIWIALLVMMMSAIFLAIYALIRRIFRQLFVLRQGVWEVSQGNLEVQIPVNSFDELGQISRSFNEMTAQVRGQLRSKEQLLLNVSHELRSPLTRMKLQLEFLEDETMKSRLGWEVAVMDHMLEELLESARLEHEYGVLRKTPVDLVGLVHRCLEEVLPSPQCARLTVPDQAVVISLDERRIYSLLKNLLENGLKYSNPLQTPLQINLQTTSTEVYFCLQDFGEGIPSEDLPHIFEAFYRVDKSRNQRTGGYGLGLALCKKIAEAHGGSLSVQSQRGWGSTFTLRLPLVN